jgi:hypothetical protein
LKTLETARFQGAATKRSLISEPRLGPDGADSPIKGTDFAVLRDGQIHSITGFLDQVPQGA